MELQTTTPLIDRNQLRFSEFLRSNPHVYEALVEHALALKAAGVKHYSIKALFEVCRYNAYLTTNDPASCYKLNNSYTSLFARHLMKTQPELNGFFRLRKRHPRPRRLVTLAVAGAPSP